MVTALPGGAGLREVPGRRIAGRQQVHELAAAAESLSSRVWGSPARWCSRGRSPAGEPSAGGVPACGSGELDGAVHTCTRDRRRGWPGARTYGGRRRRSGHPLMVFTQVTGQVKAGAGCKTVGSAYVGSNPTPATTSENGPLAAETRPGGPFPSRNVMYQGGSLWVDARQWLRTYSGQRPGETSGAYNRWLCWSAPVLSRYRTAGSRAFRSAGSSLSSRTSLQAGLVRTRGWGGLAGSGPRHLIETPRRG